MKGDDFVPLLGLIYGDKAVKGFLDTCGITKIPKLKQGDPTAIVKNPKLGLEVIFTDEQEFDAKAKQYEEGSLVLSNVTMYDDGPLFRRFTGELPRALQFDLDLKAAQAKLGGPGKKNKHFPIVHWDFKTHYVILHFDKKYEHILDVSLQLPVPS
jgi:hypothetical protein